MRNQRRPDPHPLDFDWRFTAETVSSLIPFIGKSRPLLFGMPSLALELSERRFEHLLVDRQPFSLTESRNFVNADIRYSPLNLGKFENVFFDAPWYLEDLLHWFRVAAQHVSDNGRIIFSIWPDHIRPNAYLERRAAIRFVSEFGRITERPTALAYETPAFERASLASMGFPTEKSWRRGDLVIVEMENAPSLESLPIKFKESGRHWKRFTFGSFQIAVRLSDQESVEPKLLKIGQSWTMPSVSRRWEGRSEIDLWTSDNRIARLVSPNVFARALCNMQKKCTPASLEEKRALELLSQHQFLSEPFGDKESLKWSHPE